MAELVVGGAQMGPVQRADSRAIVVARMIALLERAAAAGVEMLIYPELALTTFFPRWYMADPVEADAFFEREMPNAATAPLFARARELRIAISFGYAELTPEGRRFNTAILTDRAGRIVGKYRKIHLPGHSEYDPERSHQHLEKRYFEPGDLGFPVWRNAGVVMGMAICNDRRWPETYRCLGLQGVELVVIGYNTPSVNSLKGSEGLERRMFHSDLSLQAGAYQNATYVVGVAKAGIEDGHRLMGGSIIVDPDGVVLARAETEDDELIAAPCDFAACAFGKSTIFDFARHRRPEHYGRITAQTGATVEV
ncbi:N-carbamoyl-D-amino-acid hydrolase [Methylobacterium sp. NEAU K]|uniref:N-carbamoyl-D-amino-acid hydrolase n=1 Tax=Methylobacterium sp. NEAU K TaxID=3064946 RepID=UPI00273668E7|nr:N-carbamoyl-D-amino-acid hydrolase [Methylobacterium sp. NEAU K]MDP4002230.1 N-carbamoyl-D-amino-acid hydrolase [Methylobacterium sp. NEAU K]